MTGACDLLTTPLGTLTLEASERGPTGLYTVSRRDALPLSSCAPRGERAGQRAATEATLELYAAG